MYHFKIKRGDKELDGLFVKTHVLKVDEDSSTGFFEGLLSVTGNIDQGADRVMSGAFKKTLKEKAAFPYLLDHNPTKPAGFFEAQETSKGLVIQVEMPLHDPVVKQRFSLIKLSLKKKVPMGQSIGYSAVKVSFEEVEDKQVRNLEEVKLFEGSSVVFPMNVLATVTDAKTIHLLDLISSGAYDIDQLNEALGQLDSKKSKSDSAAKEKIDPDLLQSIRAMGKLKY